MEMAIILDQCLGKKRSNNTYQVIYNYNIDYDSDNDNDSDVLVVSSI